MIVRTHRTTKKPSVIKEEPKVVKKVVEKKPIIIKKSEPVPTLEEEAQEILEKIIHEE